MKRKSAHPDFDQTLELLRAHSFDVAPYPGVEGGVLVTKHGAGAVLVAAPRSKNPDDPAAAFAIHPGVMVKGEVAEVQKMNSYSWTTLHELRGNRQSMPRGALAP